MISIIIPVYNSAKYLRECLDSILKQTFSDYEVILIDDGSTDNSAEVYNEYTKKDNRITAIRVENSGVSNARNLGVSMAKGEYIRFMDADDYIGEKSLEYLYDAMRSKDDIDLVIGKYESNDNEIYTGDLKGVVEVKDMITHLVTYIRTFYYGVTWNKLYKASIIKENKIEFDRNVSWAEDYFFNLLYYSCIKNINFIDEPVYYYVRRENTLVSSIGTYSIDAALDMEMLRFYSAYKLVKQVNPTDENIKGIYNFFFNKVNDKLNEVVEKEEFSEDERFKIFTKIVCREDVNKYIDDCILKNDYFLNNYTVKCVKKKKYKKLYRVYKFKRFLKKNKMIKAFFTKNKTVLPKFPL